MTESEAKRIPDETLDNAISVYKTVIKAVEKNPDSDYSTILDKVTVELLEELKAYRAIGTVEEFKAIKQWKSDIIESFSKYDVNSVEELMKRFRELTEKAEPKKVVIREIPKTSWTRATKQYICPSCNMVISFSGKRYCSGCGQRLDWE